jgi:dihydroorotase
MQHSKDILIRNLRPIGGDFDGSKAMNLEIRDGKIAAWHDVESKTSTDGMREVDMSGAYVSPGWMDMHVHLREPGFEHKETIASGCAAAAFGGFTALACMPNTNPPIHTRDVVEYIIRKSESLPVAVHPIACVSKDRKGKQLTEMADMKEGGAVAFSDDGDPVYDARLMRVALEYSSMLDMPIINHEEDLSLSRPGHMNEGAVSTRLGLQGTPGIAEEVMIARDILLAEFTGGHVHVAHISTRRGVELVREAKARGIKVTTEVCPHHYDLTDEEIDRSHFDTNYKMHPPLRTEDDRIAMIEGLKDGTIDAICTDHAPHAVEEKEVEFIYAPNGILGLETAWPVTVRRLLDEGGMSLPAIMKCLIEAPRTILHLPVPTLAVGTAAELTFFNTDEEWTYEQRHIKSKSVNTPYIGQRFKGRATGVYNRGMLVVNGL